MKKTIEIEGTQKEFDLKPSSWKILEFLRDSTGIDYNTSQVASHTEINPSGIYRYVKELEQEKLIRVEVIYEGSTRNKYLYYEPKIKKEVKKEAKKHAKKQVKKSSGVNKSKVNNTNKSKNNLLLNEKVKALLMDFEVIETYLRKGNRPAQTKLVENFKQKISNLI